MVLIPLKYQLTFDQDASCVPSRAMTLDLKRREFETTKQSTKRVRFDTTKNVQYSSQRYKSYNYKDNWYKSKDYFEFRAIATYAARLVNYNEKYGTADSFQQVKEMERVLDACSKALKNEEILSVCELNALQYWLEHPDCQCGLEKCSIPKMFRDSKMRKGELYEAVFEIQNNTKNKEWDVNSTEESMRLSCETITRPSRLFAYNWALVLAYVVKKENNLEVRILI